jgi:hypothetical protein
MPSQLLP